MPQKIIAGNWKMNLELDQALNLVKEIANNRQKNDARVMVFPTSVFVKSISDLGVEALEVGVQNFFIEDAGAYTGELSIPQAQSTGASIGLIGHSERRAFFGEHHEFLKTKVSKAIAHGFGFIFCCGEPLQIREANEQNAFVKKQLEESLFHLSAEQMKGCIIAYEPVWAIGTGKTATVEQAEAMHAEIRSWLKEKYGQEIAESVSILYGGSCNEKNAKELFSCPNVDGGLIGGAALKVDSFCAIIDAI